MDNHELDCVAEWWLPHDPENRVAGSLTFDEDAGALVELVGLLSPNEDPQLGKIRTGFMVHGRDRTGRALVLLDALAGTRTTTYTDGEERISEQLRARTVLVGHRFPPTADSFTACTFSLVGLAEWANQHFRILESPERTAEGSPRHGVILKDPSSFTFDVPEGRLTLAAGGQSSGSSTREEYSVSVSWRYDPQLPHTVDEFWKLIIHPLEMLHTLLTGEATYPTDIQLELPIEDEDPIPSRMKVWSAWSKPKATNVGPFHDWLFRISDVIVRLDDLVNRWLRLLDEVEQALALLFSVLDGKKDLYLENRYLAACQAAEGYHRNRSLFDERILTDEELSKRLAHLLAQSPSEWHEWLRPRLQYGYQPSFRQRIRELGSYAGPIGKDLLAGTSLGGIVDVRNELTHVLDHVDSDERVEMMAILSEKVLLLMKACLARDLGFDEDEVSERMADSEYARFLVGFQPPPAR